MLSGLSRFKGTRLTDVSHFMYKHILKLEKNILSHEKVHQKDDICIYELERRLLYVSDRSNSDNLREIQKQHSSSVEYRVLKIKIISGQRVS